MEDRLRRLEDLHLQTREDVTEIKTLLKQHSIQSKEQNERILEDINVTKKRVGILETKATTVSGIVTGITMVTGAIGVLVGKIFC